MTTDRYAQPRYTGDEAVTWPVARRHKLLFRTASDLHFPTIHLRRELEDPKKLPLTVGRVVILNSEGEIALLRRANSSRPETNGFWELPGGKRDPGEGSLQGIVREAREETGLWIDPKTGLTVIYSKDMTGGDRHGQKLINLACVAQVVAGELTFDPQEASAAQWVTRDGLSEMHGADQLRPMTLETVDYFLRAA